jgi:hypothetical protein
MLQWIVWKKRWRNIREGLKVKSKNSKNKNLLVIVFFVIFILLRAFGQCSTSLCHSLVLHTFNELLPFASIRGTRNERKKMFRVPRTMAEKIWV